MTYKEAWFIVRVWTLPQTKRELPSLKPSFLYDIAFMRVHQAQIYHELRVHIEGPIVRPIATKKRSCDHNTGKPRANSSQPIITYAALQQKVAAMKASES